MDIIKNNFYKLIFIFFISSLILLEGCSSSGKTDINTDDPQTAFSLAKRNYDKEDYLQAIEDFSFIKVKFSGSNIIDKAQYYLAMCYFKREEFVLSAYEFETFVKNYPASSLMVEARYQLGMCYYNLSPKYTLDQTYTRYAIMEFQNFLSLYPNDKLAPKAEQRIQELRSKLAYKLLKSGDLYMTMENYKSAIIYYDLLLEEYFDSDYADDALYGKIQALMKKKKYEDVKKEIERFEKRFPQSEFISKVRLIKKEIPS